MPTWLMDTPLLNMLGAPKTANLRRWLEANNASLFLSAASVTEIGAAISKRSAKAPHRSNSLRSWLDELTLRFADRIHQVDLAIAMRAGALLPGMRSGFPRHRVHDAYLVATAQIHGHGLLTRRDRIFGPWTKVPIITI